MKAKLIDRLASYQVGGAQHDKQPAGSIEISPGPCIIFVVRVAMATTVTFISSYSFNENIIKRTRSTLGPATQQLLLLVNELNT